MTDLSGGRKPPFDSGDDVSIRLAGRSDAEAMSHVFREAFESEGVMISRLSIDLLRDETGMPSFALIAESAGETVGCVLFSKAWISGHEEVRASILAPLAVVKYRQLQGIGRKLIEAGIDRLRAMGTDLVFVLGDPAHYNRHGFDYRHHVQAPYDLPYPEAWMIRELTPGAIEAARGHFRCAQTLMAPELW